MSLTTGSSSNGPSISPKLLGVLALTVLIAAIGAWRLMADDSRGEVGFDGAEPLPVAVAGTTPALEPIGDVPLVRNPFVRSITASDTFTPTEPSATEPETITESPPSGVAPVQITPRADDPLVSSAGATPPAFPLPDLVEQGPPSRSDRDDFTG